MRLGTNIDIIAGLIPGYPDQVIDLHDRYYRMHWGFGDFFVAKVRNEITEFTARFNPLVDGTWHALLAGCIEASVTIDGTHLGDGLAHLRWFIASERLRGSGAGGALLGAALAFCAERGFRAVQLWTFAGLDTARYLYEKNGFVLSEEALDTTWGAPVTEQCFIKRF